MFWVSVSHMTSSSEFWCNYWRQ